jgi:hypothetical protein
MAENKDLILSVAEVSSNYDKGKIREYIIRYFSTCL